MKLLIAAALTLPLTAQAYTRAEAVQQCQAVAGTIHVLADRRDDGMTKAAAIKKVDSGNPTTQQRAGALSMIDLVWSFPAVSGFQLQDDFFKQCMKEQQIKFTM